MPDQFRADFVSSSGLRIPPALEGLKVALVHDWLTGRRGGEKCLEVLVDIFPSARLFTLIHEPGSAGPIIERLNIQTSPLQRIPGVIKNYRSLLPLMPIAARSWNVGDADLVISLSHCVAKAIRVPNHVPHVCYCFTPMRYAWEERGSYLESWSHKPLRRLLAGWLLDRLQTWDRRTSDRVSHFIAISETIKKRIQASYLRDSLVIQPPVDTEFYRRARLPREPFYLVVSALVPYKRIDQAISACVALGKPLVVIGEGPDRDRLQALASTEVQFMGWQPDEVIRDHLQRCQALLFPGVEDFGIVPMEALACGAPVIALDAGGVAETVDNAVGWLYSPSTTQGLINAIKDWENAGCPNNPELGRSRAEAFSTSRFRHRLMSELVEIVIASRISSDRTKHHNGPHHKPKYQTHQAPNLYSRPGTKRRRP